MEPIYRQIFEISDIHLDRFGRVKPSVLLYFAQEVAGQHCVSLAVDWDTLDKRHLFWAVLRNRVQITRLPGRGDKITVETWPMPTTRVAYPRSVVAYDEKGEEVFRSISLWVLMDTRTRSMVLPANSGVEVMGTVRGMELALPNSIVPKKFHNVVTRTVGYTELDRNGHMNNTRCMDWIDDLLPSAFHREHPVREFTVCYISEATEGQELELEWELHDGPELRVEAHRKDETAKDKQVRIFGADILF